MCNPADDGVAEHILLKRRSASMAHPASWEDYLEWQGYQAERGPSFPVSIDPRFGQPVRRGTIAVPVYKKDSQSSKRVGALSKEATKEMLAVEAEKQGRGLVDEAVAFFRKTPDERDELRKEGK